MYVNHGCIKIDSRLVHTSTHSQRYGEEEGCRVHVHRGVDPRVCGWDVGKRAAGQSD